MADAFVPSKADPAEKCKVSERLHINSEEVYYGTYEIIQCDSLDTDGDGIPDLDDNCPDDANPDQSDFDEDELVIITVYIPKLPKWSDPFTRRA